MVNVQAKLPAMSSLGLLSFLHQHPKFWLSGSFWKWLTSVLKPLSSPVRFPAWRTFVNGSRTHFEEGRSHFGIVFRITSAYNPTTALGYATIYFWVRNNNENVSYWTTWQRIANVAWKNQSRKRNPPFLYFIENNESHFLVSFVISIRCACC